MSVRFLPIHIPEIHSDFAFEFNNTSIPCSVKWGQLQNIEIIIQFSFSIRNSESNILHDAFLFQYIDSTFYNELLLEANNVKY